MTLQVRDPVVKKWIYNDLFSLSQLKFYIFAIDILPKPYNITLIFYYVSIKCCPKNGL